MNYLRLEHPARYYIFWLFAQRRYKAKDVLSQLLRQGMPVPRDQKEFDQFQESLELAQRELQFPPGFDPGNLGHIPTAEWLRAHRVYDIAVHEPHVTYAIDILDQPSIRRELEIMLLGPLNYGDIAKRICSHHGLDPKIMTASTVKYYAHYFWNVEALSMQKWPALLQSMPYSEDYLSVYLSPKSQVGAAMSVYIATRGGSGIPKEQTMFRYVRDTCFMEFIKVSSQRYPGMQKTVAMQGLVNALISAQEQVDMRRGGSAELLDELRRLETRFDEKKLTAAEDLPLYSLAAETKKEQENAS
jgi:hypothetical protein